jgi:hypothetical protein
LGLFFLPRGCGRVFKGLLGGGGIWEKKCRLLAPWEKIMGLSKAQACIVVRRAWGTFLRRLDSDSPGSIKNKQVETQT